MADVNEHNNAISEYKTRSLIPKKAWYVVSCTPELKEGTESYHNASAQTLSFSIREKR